MLKRAPRGFTLVETVMVIIILGVCLAPFAALVSNVMIKNAQSQAWTTAVALAEQELERVTGSRFSGINCEALTTFSAPFAAYSYQVLVDYVNANALDTSVGQPSLCASPPGTATDYKRVRINVINSLAGNVTLTTLVAADW